MTRKLSIILAIAMVLILAPTVFAQATRTWVSGVGDDVNPCSRTAPCKTFAGAISKTAAGGEINAIDSAGYGGVTITKAMTINGAGVHASILSAGSPNGVLVNAGVNDVITLKNISFNGAGTGTNGIRFIAGKTLNVENCELFGFTNRGITVEPAGTTAARVFVSNTTIRNATNFGIVLLPSVATASITATISNVIIQNITNHGIYVGNNSAAAIRDSVISQNGGVGVHVEEVGATNAVADIEGTTINYNATGINAGAGATVTRIANTRISGNANGFVFGGGTIVSAGNNFVNGNTGGNGPACSTPGQ
ncbi:MAG TPA: right-handed parallel beta-helix repeat-containing protein, partial [Thermoanaerobaculia bacterium]|nr:right-handed parallel beta-helix repeat-containing protein [Thermoanaerobaculia bacterium]